MCRKIKLSGWRALPSSKKEKMAGAYPIEFRFIKAEPTTPNQDEVIRITPFMVGDKRQFLWRYSADNKRISTQVCIIEDEFFLYEKLRHMVELLSWDSDPYHHVQLLLPTSPSVLFRSSDFPDAIEKVIDAIRVAVRHWPVRMDTAEANKLSLSGQQTLKDSPGSFTRSGCCYTPKKEEAEDSDGQCGAPPPLVPLRKSLSKCYSDFKDNDRLGFEVKTKSRCDGPVYEYKGPSPSAYSYFGKSRLNPEDDEDSPWDT